MKRSSILRFFTGLIVFVVVFLQPNIQCSNNKSTDNGKAAGTNPIYAWDPNAGIQWAASAPDVILASDVKLQPAAKEISDDNMKYLEKADQKGGDYIFSSSALELAKLQPGSFVFFRNHSVRKIISSGKQGDKILVKTWVIWPMPRSLVMSAM
jgi:hypothetical protein